MINIITINYPLIGDNIVNTEINGDETLLDADLVIIDPSEFSSIWTKHLASRADTPTIYSPNSDRVRNTFASRRSEIETLLANGKIIVTFVYPVKGFKAEINNQSHYDIVTNYDILPVRQDYILKNLVSGKSSGVNSINLSNPKSLFASYFKAFSNELEYSAYLDIEVKDNPNFFLLNRSNKPVGFLIQSGNGIIAFLPPPPYKQDNQKLLGTLIGCAKKFLTKHEVTPPPNWVDDFKLKGENEYDLQIIELNKQLEEIIAKKRLTEDEKNQLTKYKALLYEQGPELENIVIESFKLFGFKAENRKLDDLEHDVVFESKEGKGIAEIEGKDNDAIHIHKLDQLNRAVDEDFELTSKYPQGVLIGNHYRFSKPENRKDPFTEKVHIVAKKKSFGLLTTVEIFKAVQKILENPKDENYKKLCRANILNTTGDIIKL